MLLLSLSAIRYHTNTVLITTDTKISSHYGWIRTQICHQSRSPPAYYNCPLRNPSINSLPLSNIDLEVTFDLPLTEVEYYGLLVESLDDLHSEPLLDIPLGSLSYELDASTYSMKVQLGHRYRVVLLNTSGRSYTPGKIIVKWGDEILVDEHTQQGDLLVYSIERSFRIADVEGGVSAIDTVVGAPTQVPTPNPSNGNLFDDLNSVDGPTLDSESLFKVEEPFITLEAGFHTIDPTYVRNLGYPNSTIPVGVNITSNGFAMIDAGVTIAPIAGNALSLSRSAYLLANGGNFTGASSSDIIPSPGYGIYLEGESKVDIMGGVIVNGGDAVGQMQSFGAALHARDYSEVTIRGGEFHGGTNTIGRRSNKSSIEVAGNATVVVYGGSFFGGWDVRDEGSIVIHVCSFISLTDSVMAKLLDSSFLNVQFTSDELGSIKPEYHGQQECLGSATAIEPAKPPTASPATLRPSSLSPSKHPSAMSTSSPAIKPTATPSRGPSRSPSLWPTVRMESSLPPAGVSLSNSPTLKQIWNASDFAPDEFPDRPHLVMTFVPDECLAENTTAVSPHVI